MITFWAAIMVLAAIGVVSWPLLRGISRNGPGFAEDTEVSELLAQKDATLLAISELEADYNMGNLAQGDYQELRNKYEGKAVALLRTVDELKSERGLGDTGQIDEEIEAGVTEPGNAGDTAKPATPAQEPRGAKCPHCSAAVRASDRFCHRCGAALGNRCPKCSAEIEANDRFCYRCGAALNTVGKK